MGTPILQLLLRFLPLGQIGVQNYDFTLFITERHSVSRLETTTAKFGLFVSKSMRDEKKCLKCHYEVIFVKKGDDGSLGRKFWKEKGVRFRISKRKYWMTWQISCNVLHVLSWSGIWYMTELMLEIRRINDCSIFKDNFILLTVTKKKLNVRRNICSQTEMWKYKNVYTTNVKGIKS